MTFRERMAIAVPPLFLRIALAATFIWAGWGKLFSTIQYSPEQTAILANMGATFRQAQPGTPGPPSGQPATPDEGPTEASDGTGDERASLGMDMGYGAVLVDAQRSLADQQNQDEGQPADQPEDQPAEEPEQPADEAPQDADQPPQTPAATPQYTAEDFPAGVSAKRVYNVALVIHRGANPGPGTSPYFPSGLASGGWPVRMAWAVGIVEFAAGVFVLLGLFTRLAALGLTVLMAGVIWLAEIGPILFGPADAPSFLGFLPPLDGFNPAAWMHWLWTLALFMMALAVFFSGPGALAVDSLLFSRRKSKTESVEVRST